MAENKYPLILDADPGVDDTLALKMLFGRKDLDIRLVCSVAGNVSIDLTTANALYLTRTWGGAIPVARGGASPLGVDASYVHGAGGLGGYRIPPHSFTVDRPDAVEAMYETLTAGDRPFALVTLGPLTNVGRLLREHPDVKNKIGRIYAMIASKDGTGNITPWAEFNAYCDPRALADTAASGIEIVFAPMHLGREAKLSMDELLSRAGKTDLGDMMRDMFRGYHDAAAGDGYVAMYDANAAEAILHPELYDFVPCTAAVNVSERPGQTYLTPDPNGRCFRLEIRDPRALAETMLNDLFS